MERGEGQYNIKTRQGFVDAVTDISGLLFTISFSILRNQDSCADCGTECNYEGVEKARGTERTIKV